MTTPCAEILGELRAQANPANLAGMARFGVDTISLGSTSPNTAPPLPRSVYEMPVGAEILRKLHAQANPANLAGMMRFGIDTAISLAIHIAEHGAANAAKL
jgi:hypothetical protein